MSAAINQTDSGTPGSVETQKRGAVVPVWLIVLLFVILYWGAVYFDGTGAWFNPKVYEPYHEIAEVKALQPISGAGGVFEQGRLVFGRTCVVCHQASALGVPGQYPPLAGSDWVNEPQPGRMIRAVLNGLQGPITVNGKPFSTGSAMVAWGPTLSDDDIAAVITFVRGNKEWGNKAPPVTPAQVKAIREKIKSRMTPFTPDELLKINPAE